jgi:hypothetical protein
MRLRLGIRVAQLHGDESVEGGPGRGRAGESCIKGDEVHEGMAGQGIWEAVVVPDTKVY